MQQAKEIEQVESIYIKTIMANIRTKYFLQNIIICRFILMKYSKVIPGIF